MFARAWPALGVGPMFEKIDSRIKWLGVVLLVAQVWMPLSFGLDPIAVLAPSDQALGYGRGFGTSVAVSGDWLAVGAPQDTQVGYGRETGAVYIFRREGSRWIEHEKVFGSTLAYEAFGIAVAIDGNRLVVGGVGWFGSAYVFHRDDRGTPMNLADDNWGLAALLHAPPSDLCCVFGSSIDISGDYIVVGTTTGERQEGRAYVFRWTGLEWVLDAALQGSQTVDGDSFGNDVAVYDGIVAVTADRHAFPCNSYGTCFGIAYVFELRQGHWEEIDILFADDFGGVGESIAIYEETLIAGHAAAARAFEKSDLGWVETSQLITSSDPTLSRGNVHDLEGNIAVLGAPRDSEKGERSGAGYVLIQDGEWRQLHKLTYHEFVPHVGLGGSVSFDGIYAVLGSDINRAFVYRVCDGCGTLKEIAAFQNCFFNPPIAECALFDLCPDSSIDLKDLAEIEHWLRGP